MNPYHLQTLRCSFDDKLGLQPSFSYEESQNYVLVFQKSNFPKSIANSHSALF